MALQTGGRQRVQEAPGETERGTRRPELGEDIHAGVEEAETASTELSREGH